MSNAARVLVVDDNRIIVKDMKQKLEKANFSVLSAFDGEEAVEMLKKKKVDLMTLDMCMPRMNGAKVLIWLRLNKDEQLKSLPVIMVTKESELQNIGETIDGIPHTYFMGESETDEVVKKISSLHLESQSKKNKKK